MKQTIVINSKEYKLPKIGFNTMCELEELGFDLQNAGTQALGFIRALVAYTIKSNLSKAGEEIEKHIENGGTLADFNPLIECVKESGFFKAGQKAAK